MCKQTFTHAHPYVYKYIYMYIYMHVCTYTHLHIHIYFSQHVDLSNINALCLGGGTIHHNYQDAIFFQKSVKYSISISIESYIFVILSRKFSE